MCSCIWHSLYVTKPEMASLKREIAGAETEWLLNVAALRDENMWGFAYKLIVTVVQLYSKL